jgi:pteridine reductase
MDWSTMPPVFSHEIGQIDESAWHDLMGSNLKAPLFLSQAVAPLAP